MQASSASPGQEELRARRIQCPWFHLFLRLKVPPELQLRLHLLVVWLVFFLVGCVLVLVAFWVGFGCFVVLFWGWCAFRGSLRLAA